MVRCRPVWGCVPHIPGPPCGTFAHPHSPTFYSILCFSLRWFCFYFAFFLNSRPHKGAGGAGLFSLVFVNFLAFCVPFLLFSLFLFGYPRADWFELRRPTRQRAYSPHPDGACHAPSGRASPGTILGTVDHTTRTGPFWGHFSFGLHSPLVFSRVFDSFF